MKLTLRPSISSLLALTALLLCCSAACSLRYGFTDVECEADGDCARFESAGTFYACEDQLCKVTSAVECRSDSDCSVGMCDASNRCVSPVADMGDGDMTPAPDLGDMADMSEDMPGDAPSDMPMQTPCATNSECIAARGASFICNSDAVCVDTIDASMACKAPYYSRTSGKDNVVLFASMLPLSEPFGTLIGRPLENAIQFAVDTVNEEGGLAGGRKLAWVSCDSGGDVEVAQQVASHLANVVEVPAIIGPLFSEEYISVVSNVTNAAGVFTLTPTATSPAIRNLRQGKNLVWRNVASDEFQAKGIIERVNSLGASKVLILYKDDKYGEDLEDLAYRGLSPDFTPLDLQVLKLPNPANLDDPSREGIAQAYVSAIAPKVQKGVFEPQLVVIIGTNEGAIALSSYLIVANAQGVTPPRFLLSHGVIPAIPELGAGLEQNGVADQIVPLIEAISPEIIDLDNPIYQEYLRKYSIAFADAQPALASTTTFDAVMTIAFSAATLDAEERVTGQKIADGISKLVDKQNGVPIAFFDPSFVSAGVAALQAGDTIDIAGVSGALDYDLTRGEVYTPMVGWRMVEEMDGSYTIARARVMTFPNAPSTTGASWTEVP